MTILIFDHFWLATLKVTTIALLIVHCSSSSSSFFSNQPSTLINARSDTVKTAIDRQEISQGWLYLV